MQPWGTKTWVKPSFQPAHSPSPPLSSPCRHRFSKAATSSAPDQPGVLSSQLVLESTSLPGHHLGLCPCLEATTVRWSREESQASGESAVITKLPMGEERKVTAVRNHSQTLKSLCCGSHSAVGQGREKTVAAIAEAVLSRARMWLHRSCPFPSQEKE